MAENGNGSFPKPWGEMTEDEQQAYLEQRRLAREAGETPARKTRRRRVAETRQAIEAFDRLPPLTPEAEQVLDELSASHIAVVPVAPVPQTDRASLLMGLDPKVAAKLSDEDIEEILKEERARAEAEDKQKAMKEAREQIRSVMRAEKGLIDAATLRTREQNERLRKMVRIRFDLPGGVNRTHTGANGIRIDGRLYEVGQWHTVSVATYESMRSMHYDVWVNEIQFTTLDQANRFGITTMNRLVGTTPAKAIFAQSPHLIEVQDAAE